jgi:TLD
MTCSRTTDRLTHASGSRYYGTGESFVFAADNSSEIDVYRWARSNHYFQLSSQDFLAVGGGGHFALWIDREITRGSTAQCSTFDNPPLVSGSDLVDGLSVDFEIVVLEVWTPVLGGHFLETDLPSGVESNEALIL